MGPILRKPGTVIAALGFLGRPDHQPGAFLAKNPEAEAHKVAGNKFSSTAIYDFYKTLCQELSCAAARRLHFHRGLRRRDHEFDAILDQARTFDT